MTGGRNGFGAKLTNIYSTEFKVETVANQKRFVQVFRNHMSEEDKPKEVLMATFSLTEVQANAILDMRARTLRPREYLASLRGVDTEAVFSLRDPLPGMYELLLLLA